MEKILFVINTLGSAGAEAALMALLENMPKEYKIYLYVLTSQGEMVHRLPDNVILLNKKYDDSSVLSVNGKRKLSRKIITRCFRHFALAKNLPFIMKNIFKVLANKGKGIDKLLWRLVSDEAEYFDMEFDMAVAYLEGGSAYYVIDHVKAAKKVAFIHVDYVLAGYNRKVDKNCYQKYDKIFTVSDEVRKSFLSVYSECEAKTEVFENIINQKYIRERANEGKGFEDDFDGVRILSVGRLTEQKAFDISVDAMKLLKDKGINARWYVLGEGEQRRSLERQINKLGLAKDFVLMGAVENPYPFYKETDLYVHASKFEGKSIAIQEAQTLGCAILVSDCSGNREQITHGVDGRMCDFDSASIAAEIEYMLNNDKECEKYKQKVSEKDFSQRERLDKLFND